jgi:hypothetical protein
MEIAIIVTVLSHMIITYDVVDAKRALHLAKEK